MAADPPPPMHLEGDDVSRTPTTRIILPTPLSNLAGLQSRCSIATLLRVSLCLINAAAPNAAVSAAHIDTTKEAPKPAGRRKDSKERNQNDQDNEGR